ncbi:MAG TPA: helix-turn-helix transcriptional regulator [Mucilaginibacter sp.]|jgi:transcriptional regulator with XRE-family HTH domain
MSKKALNRLKIVLAEQGRTNKWLALKLGKNETTVSRWCTNDAQPSLEMLVNVAGVLNVDVRELLVPTK